MSRMRWPSSSGRSLKVDPASDDNLGMLKKTGPQADDRRPEDGRSGSAGRGGAGGGDEGLTSALKRKAYLVVLPLGAVAFLASLLVRLHLGGRVTELDVYAHPTVALCSLLLAVVLWRRPQALRATEVSTYVVVALLFLAKFRDILYVGAGGPGMEVELATFASWVPIMYVIPFLYFGARRGLRAALLFFCALAAMGFPLLADAALGAAAVRPDVAEVLVQLYLGGALVTATLSISARLMDAHASERARAEGRAADMERVANTDFLTGLQNRRSAYDVLRHELEASARYGQPLSVILFDLDHFKRVNDQHGHDVGDLLLKEISRLAQQSLRKADLLGRWGGEEFIAVSPGTRLEAGRASAERLVRTLKGHRFPKVGEASASFGVAAYRPGDSTESLLKRADDALYAAKQAGRGRVEVEVPPPQG